MGFDLDGDALAISEADIGCMRLTVYRIHDTTNHLFINLFINCLSIHSTNHL